MARGVSAMAMKRCWCAPKAISAIAETINSLRKELRELAATGVDTAIDLVYETKILRNSNGMLTAQINEQDKQISLLKNQLAKTQSSLTEHKNSVKFWRTQALRLKEDAKRLVKKQSGTSRSKRIVGIRFDVPTSKSSARLQLTLSKSGVSSQRKLKN